MNALTDVGLNVTTHDELSPLLAAANVQLLVLPNPDEAGLELKLI